MSLRSPVARALALAVFGAAAWSVASPAHALEPQFRQVKLVDGRTLMAEILATEAQGLRMRVPQGEMLISFELLLDMVPISQSQYDTQAEWVVYFDVPEELEQDTLDLLNAIPGIEPQPVDTPGNGIVSGTAFEAASCDRDVDCMADAVRDTSWKWVLAARLAETGGVVVKSKLNTSTDRASEIPLEDPARAELWKALHTALGLFEPDGPPPRSAGEDEGRPTPVSSMDSKKVVALSFVPVPGIPSLAQSDVGGFALALGVVVPSTVVWVGAVGQTGQTAPEFGALSFAGYYAVTVLANQVTGMRSLEKRRPVGVSALPTDGGGTVMLAGEF